MTTLREAAQQALEALEQLQGGCTDSDDGTVEAITVWCPEVIEALKAALAEDDGMYGARALAKAYENGWNAAKEHTCDTRCTWADHAVGCVRAEPVQEPVAWMFDWDVYDPTNLGPDFSQTKPNDGKTWTPLFTHPPRREWQGLTAQEIHNMPTYQETREMYRLARAIEQALKEKNHE